LLPKALNRPPITAVGSTPGAFEYHLQSSTSSSSCRESRPTAMENRSRISSASISARGITGMPRRRASTNLRVRRFHRRRKDHHLRLADVFRPMPLVHLMPNFFSSRVATAERFTSDPLTSKPRFASSSAIPLMPMPPMPTK
jgi:hypothetical protein